ncbi:hypothetical protein PFTANZ_05875, partial [Plasmodium falciparum Tanzania (2000708)]
MKQEVFCNGGNNYAFKHPPKEYEDACICDTRDKKSEAPVTKKEEACKIVDGILNGKSATDDIDGCKPKENYKPWNCDEIGSLIKKEEKGACMPPRRQKLCVSGLTREDRIKAIEDIRTEFIKSAAIETHFAWERYKRENREANEQLQNETIPYDFLRSMKYTFGDYRDIFFGTDISSCLFIKGTSNEIKSKLGDQATTEKGGKHPNGKTRQEWWKTNGPDIWEGMLCALTHGVTNTEKKTKIKTDYSYDKLNQSKNGNPSLENFAKKPQFLRWMIEWGEEFCREREKLEQNIGKHCGEHSGDA